MPATLERDAQLELDTHNVELLQAYADQAEARRARWQLLAQKLGVPLMPLHTAASVSDQLREHLQAQRPRKTR